MIYQEPPLAPEDRVVLEMIESQLRLLLIRV
jgi:hypothetical protein